MYWRDYYPDYNAAARAERLGDLGKVKLTPQQKAAITQAKQEARVKAVQYKLDAKQAKRDVKLARLQGKKALVDAKYRAKVAAQNVDAASMSLEPQAVVPSNLAPQVVDSGAMSFAPSGGGGGGGGMPAPVENPAQSAGGFDMTTLAMIGGGLLLVLLFLKK